MVGSNAPGTPTTDDAELVTMLLACGAVRFGSFTLASGAASDVYVDIKRAWTDPRRLAHLARALAARVGTVDALAGMELGAVPLVVATALRTGHPYLVIRKAAKEHGTKQRYEGDVTAGARILLIEDVATSGGSAAESIQVLRDAGAQVDRALVVVDREVGATARLAAMGVTLEPLTTLRALREAPK